MTRPEILSAIDALSESLDRVTPEDAAILAGRLEEIRLRLVRRAMTPPAPMDDELLDVPDAAKAIGISEWYIYRHGRTLPFVLKVGSRTMCSKRLIREWIRKKAGARS